MTRRRWAVVLGVALAVTALAAAAASRLRVETRLVDVLPQGTPAAEDYRVFLELFGGVELVYAVVVAEPGADGELPDGSPLPPDPARLAEAADRLARRMAATPEVADARSGLTAEDEAFFLDVVLPRAPLLAADDAAVARRLDPGHVRERVRELRQRLRTPAGAATARLLAADPLGFLEALPGEEAAPIAPASGGAPIDPGSGAFLAADGSAALVVITPAAGELDAAAGRELAAALEAAAADVAAELGGGIAVHAAGGPLYAAQDETILRGDLTRTVTGSALGVALLLVVAFGGVREPLALLAAVAIGIVWTAGLAALALGSISGLGIGFAAILLGLGVEYGIHGAARYRLRRLAGRPPEAAIADVRREAGAAILGSAVITACAFLVLALADFRPVRELGVLVAAGVVATLAATAAVAAPLLVLLDRRPAGSAPPREGRIWRAAGALAEAAAGLGARRPKAVLAAVALATAAAALALPRIVFDADPRAFRPADHPALAAEAVLGERFGVGLDAATLVVEGATAEEALARAAGVAAAARRAIADDPASAGAAAATAADWLPPAAALGERARARGGEPAAAAAAALRAALAEEGLAEARFRPTLAVLDALAAGEPPPPVPVGEWPEWLRRAVVAVPPGEGGGAAVAVRLTAPLGVWPDGPPAAVTEAALAAGPGTAVASLPRLVAEVQERLAGSLRRLGGWALAAVAAVVLVSFRGRPLPALLALAPVVLGLVWTLGLAAALGLPLDPFSLQVAPLLLGLGVDNGLHAVHGAAGPGGFRAGALHRAVAAAGRPIALATLTNAVGFGSLALSRLPALSRGGLLVAGGALLCLAATLVVLPAVGALAGRPARRDGRQ